MKLAPLPLGGMALALLLTQAPAAQAELIPWMYSWSNSSPLTADSPGTSTIVLTNQPLTAATSDSAVVSTNLTTTSTAPPAHPDTFTHAAYTLNLYLYDSTAKEGNTLQFTGYIDGTVSSGGRS